MRTIFTGVLSVTLALVGLGAAHAEGDEWQNVASFPQLFGYAITYGNGKFVTIPGFGYSPDNGLSWYQGFGVAPLDNPPYLIVATYTKLIFNGSRFLALANTGQTSTSTDGVHWTSSRVFPDPGFGGNWDITFGADRFVATSSAVGFATSIDGEHWTKVEGVSTNRPSLIAYGNGKFLATFGATLITGFAESIDGLHWTTRPAPIFYMDADCQTNGCPQMTSVMGLTFSTGKFVILAYSNSRFELLSSLDGIAWTPGQTFSYTNPGRSTPNLIHDVNGTVQQDNIEFGSGVYVTVGSQISSGPSLGQLLPVSRGEDLISLYSVAAHGGTIIGAGESRHYDETLGAYAPAFFTSTNGGRTFETRTNLTSSRIRKLIYANGKFLGVGDNGLIVESTLGLSWNELACPVNWSLLDIATGNGRWVITANSAGGALFSTDGARFEKGSGTNIFYNVAFGANLFVASGPNNTFFTSANGSEWTQAQSPASGFPGRIAFGNGRFVSGSNISDDGLVWRNVLTAVPATVFSNGKFYAALPAYNVPFGGTIIYSSTDAFTWESTIVPALLQNLEVSDGTLWLFNSQRGSTQTIWRLGPSSMQLRVEAIAGVARIHLDVPEPGRYRIQRSATVDGPWQPGDLLDIGFRAGWDEPATDPGAAQFFNVVRE